MAKKQEQAKNKSICLDGPTVYRLLESKVSIDRKDFVVHVPEAEKDPFLALVAIILSQNTNDKNSIRALRRLLSIGSTPEDFLRVGVEKIMDAIRISGGYRRKAETILMLSKFLVEKGGTRYLVETDPELLREELSKIKGIGPKTVDVFLSFYRGVRVFPVDTHARRIAWRWGLVSKPSVSYKLVSSSLAGFFGDTVDYEKAHKLIISFGRSICRARNPRCEICPLKECCPSARS
ncbi:MAG: endonuclease III [Desulfurococcales archaeon]|nr:endonuclease III [Desulfurococcales archaeon]